MNLPATIAKMRAAGMTSDAIVMALECVVIDERPVVVDEQAERRRAKDRERKRLRNSAESAENPSPLNPPLPPAPLSPPIIPPSRSGVLQAQALETKLREAAGWQNQPHPGLFVTGPIETLLANGADLEVDVLPVVRGWARKVRRPSGWAYFVGPIQDAVQARIAAATGPPQTGEVVPFNATSRSQNGPRPQTIAAGFDLIDRAIEQRERQLAAAQAGQGRGEDDPVALP